MLFTRKQSVVVLFIAVLAAAAVTATVTGQEEETTEYLIEPFEDFWSERLQLNVEIQEDNGVFLSPDYQRLVVTSVGGVFVIDPDTGDTIKTYPFSSVSGGGVRCYGGVHFSMNSIIRYFTFMVIEGPGTDNAVTRVIGLDFEGEELFVSQDLPGEGAGTPISSFDGTYIALTHNVDGMIGHFSVLEVDPTSFTNVTIAQTSTNQDVIAETSTTSITVQQDVDVESFPFSPVGYYHNPIRGMYNGGESNQNDIFVFCNDIRSDRTNVTTGDGRIYVSQAPGYDFISIHEENWISSNPPTIGNEGKSLYWAVSKANNYAWVDDQTWFRPETSRLAIGQRGEPRYIAGRAPPTLSNALQPNQTTVFGVGASNLIWKADYALSELSLLTKTTSDVVYTKIAITADNSRIFYTTIDGNVICADAANLNDLWVEIENGENFAGEIAYDESRGVLIVPSTSGALIAYRVANVPTTEPTTRPTNAPVISPTTSPTEVLTEAPTLTPSGVLSVGPTLQPVTAPTSPMPSIMTVTMEPNSKPTAGPTIAARDPKSIGTLYPVIMDTPSPTESSSYAISIQMAQKTILFAMFVIGMMML